ncbi:hypothetical protein, partial [Serratia marcescens]|uniref:hypothetical protein n=1 Tax=Serratia marcescens TaxID=615 RepID=UPI0024CBD37C
GWGIRNANSDCGFFRSGKTIALSVKGKNNLYGITVNLLLGLEYRSQLFTVVLDTENIAYIYTGDILNSTCRR